MKSLIINADDFGVTAGVNRAIIECYHAGVLTSTTLLANGAAYDEAVELARTTPGLGVGAHLNLTTGHPLLPADSVPSLVDGTGRFHPRGRLMRRAAFRQINPAEVARELRAQVGRLRDSGLRITHLDSHQHVHAIPSIFPVVLDLAREHRLPLRLPAEPMIWRACPFAPLEGRPERSRRTSPFATLEGRPEHGRRAWSHMLYRPFTPRFWKKIALRWSTARQRRTLVAAGIPTTDAFLSPFGLLPPARPSVAVYQALLDRVSEGITELMVHPGYADATLAAFWTGGWPAAQEREAELRALLDPAFKARIHELGIQLMDFSVL